ncbi:MAG TPA: DUF465 domain-containing protein [Brevundimonas sp.]|jgi:hypothetical protein|uniref:YdcH family protein n=1 Tax=Brevundimonas sp. TaxID=1871086 RepID=UPI002C7B40C2|nr:DUF465 domain-containing protein [Brevundimonas sp.]HRH19599.1 DUF465 domain-containing protein [Brevundimonas sp.]
MPDSSGPINDDDGDLSDTRLRKQVALLRQEHADLSASIEALSVSPQPDQLLIARLKRKKLALKDEILRIEAMILPDIIA